MLQHQLKSIGELAEERIGFATKTVTQDNYGGSIDSFSVPATTIYAKVRYESVDEVEDNLKEKAVTQIKVWVQYSSSYTFEKYIYWRSKYYDIIGVEQTPHQRLTVIKARLIES
jgi:head-tail adaptor